MKWPGIGGVGGEVEEGEGHGFGSSASNSSKLRESILTELCSDDI